MSGLAREAAAHARELRLPALARAAGQLDGDYASALHGRSLDVSDLREYEAGDLVRDIDWLASARRDEPIVKRYTAYRRRRVLLVTAGGAEFSALAASGEVKREVALCTAALLGTAAVRHGDGVGLIAGGAGSAAGPGEGVDPVRMSAPVASSTGLEAVLRAPVFCAPAAVPGGRAPHRGVLRRRTRRLVPRAAGSSGAARYGSRAGGCGKSAHIREPLRWAAERLAGRCVLLVIADEAALTPADFRLLTRLRAQHEVFWITVADAHLTGFAGTGREPVDPASGTRILAELLAAPGLAEAYEAAEAQRRAALDARLRGLAVPHARIPGTAGAAPALRRMLREAAHER
ncbi:DUF58 domain-containing protein [Brevibacterium sp. BRM-1]|uniref:DUF58 domain-containing protein n=1 Tax=Brevibacterium sp. BRM-1 TaxID=2999062 RepID=UPI002281CF0F|nr:DUF58 domain-containing protein [Brevibacterium sp. BRM-1]WAL40231.1 DUF58 domain-containing protein [Brevibacterium sp. BRM-1]